ncbi:tRNA endonuclease ANKZF1-like [Lycorma delicatula]|uniref:tRNA endonuclease ANKZF1-like n=1 Tax=Lycorma delicatula TaxID=130591 RepID=UPI003F5184EC
MDKPEVSAAPTSNSVKLCSIFNVKEYNDIINIDCSNSNCKSDVRISKLMKLNFNTSIPQSMSTDDARNTQDSLLPSSTEKLVNLNDINATVTLPSTVSNTNTSSVCLSNNLVPDVKFCSFCNVGFIDQIEQRQHYKLDWHRYNIKLNIKQKQSVSEVNFNQLMMNSDNCDNDDISSISGSESDNESSDIDIAALQPRLNNINITKTYVGNKTRILFENKIGNIIAFYKCLFHNIDKVDENSLTESVFIDAVNKLPNILPNSKWFVVMLGGGHFAAAVFKGSEPILHKTFHSYTVRAKQGGSQSSKDSRRATGAKSAGASLRRYNEQSLLQHIQDILTAWSNEIAECQLIFHRAVGPSNRSILFGGKHPPLDKNDSRLYTIPFPTRRATFSEVKRVHSLLSSINIYESEEVFSSLFQLNNLNNQQTSSSSSPVKKKIDKDGGDKSNRASKQRQSPTRDNYEQIVTDLITHNKLEESTSDSDDNNENAYSHSVNDENVSFTESLQEYYNTPVPKKKQQHSGTAVKDNDDNENTVKTKKKKRKNEKLQLNIYGKNAVVGKLTKNVHLACINGDISGLINALNEFKEIKAKEERDCEQQQVDGITVVSCDDNIILALNQVTQDGLTLLQHASKNAFKDVIQFLLENGANPCARDKKSMTAYDFAPDKETRNVFRRFMGEYPDRYDYSKSHIPSPLTDSIEKEMAEKRKALKKAKRQKEKEKRIADEPRRQEEAEKKRFLSLSDREKRALAAERRILAAVGKAADNLALVRCYKCAVNITGKVPFEYNNFVFCSMDCLKAHRLINKTNQL